MLDQSSNNNLISGNTITDSYSALLLRSSHHNIVSGNIIANNSAFGVDVSDASYNVICGNTIINSSTRPPEYPKYAGGGVYLLYSSNNKVYHNNFINNTKQADSVGYYNNTWDDGYPSGGNYWSDYTGVDDKSGPNQDQPGSDGIGDTPYVIDVNNQDRYPLMAQIEDITPPSSTHDYDGLWYTTDFTISLTATDDLSGVAETYYKINDGPTKTVSINGQPLITTEGANNKLEYWSIDEAGNPETHHILTGIKLDKTAPTGFILINNGDAYTTSTSVTLTLTSSDATSGVYQVRYSNDGDNNLVSSHNNTLLDNTQMYSENGIYLTGESKDNTVSGNIVQFNNRYGILLDQFSSEAMPAATQFITTTLLQMD